MAQIERTFSLGHKLGRVKIDTRYDNTYVLIVSPSLTEEHVFEPAAEMWFDAKEISTISKEIGYAKQQAARARDKTT